MTGRSLSVNRVLSLILFFIMPREEVCQLLNEVVDVEEDRTHLPALAEGKEPVCETLPCLGVAHDKVGVLPQRVPAIHSRLKCASVARYLSQEGSEIARQFLCEAFERLLPEGAVHLCLASAEKVLQSLRRFLGFFEFSDVVPKIRMLAHGFLLFFCN